MITQTSTQTGGFIAGAIGEVLPFTGVDTYIAGAFAHSAPARLIIFCRLTQLSQRLPPFSTLTLSALVDTAPVAGAGNTRLFYIVEELTFHDGSD